jgi:hypothetical protein
MNSDNCVPQFSWWNTHVDIFHNFVDDVIKWALVDAKSEILLDTLHATNPDNTMGKEKWTNSD